MPHDESGSVADLVQPGIRALAANERAKPSLGDRVSTYSFGVSQRTEQAGWWGRDVWEQVSNYKGAVALAIQPYLDYFLGAKYQAFRKRPKSVRKSVAGGFSKYSRDDDYEPLEDDHPVSVLLREPGGESGAFTLGYEMCFGYLQYLITGSAPYWLPPNADGKPCQIYALVAAHLLPATPPGADAAYPQGAYRIAPASGYGWTTTAQLTANTLLPAEQVRVMRKPHPLSRHWGMSPMQLGAKQIDLLNAIVDFQWSYFNEGVALDTVVTLPGADADTVARVRDSLLQKHGGARKARALAVFGGAAGMEGGKGATVQNLAPSPKEMDFANGREVALQEVMAFFGTPKLLAGYGDSSNYATYIGQVRMFRDMRLKPAFEGVSEFLTRHLARPWQEDGEEIVIAAEPQIPKDEDQERQELQSALQAGAITVNEYRLATGRDPYEGGDVPLSVYVQVKQQEVAPPPQAQPGADPTAPPGGNQLPGDFEQEMGGSDPASGNPDDSEQGTQEATLQAALAALGMGGTDAGPEDEPVQKAKLPAKPGGAPARARQEGEVWTSAGGKRWTKKDGKIVPAPQPGGSGTGGPGASASRPAGQSAPAPAQPQSGTAAGPSPERAKFHAQILKTAGKGAKAFGLTPEVLAKMHPSAVDTIAAQLGVKPPEEHYAPHAAAVPVTPRSQPVLQRAGEWADAMAAKHAARVAQRLGIKPELAQKILAKAIRQVAEHALKNGGRASGTLSVGGQSLRLGVKVPQGEPGGAKDGAGERDQPGIAKSMNTLSDPDGGFLVPAGNMPRRKRRKRRRVCDVVRKAFADAASIEKAAAHAPKGGVSVQGKDYAGGQFIPHEVMESATEEEKRAVLGGKPKGRQTPASLARRAHAHALKTAIAKFHAAKKPTREERAANRRGMKAIGANKYRKNLVGNSRDRKKRRDALLTEFGDGTTCPCIYCGVSITHGTLEQDKLYTTGEGGRYRKHNIVPACSGCNKHRSDKPFLDFASRIKAREGGGDSDAAPPTEKAIPQELQDLAGQWVASSTGLSEELKLRYTNDTAQALAGLPAQVLESVKKVMGFRKFAPTYHADNAALNKACSEITGKRSKGVEGFVHTKSGSPVGLHLDGGSETDSGASYRAVGTYVHELWHVADDGYHSSTDAWKSAWKREIKGGPANKMLSRYAMTNEEEGLAEFGRYIAEHGAEVAKARYPKCYAALEKQGLL